jgi:hypothetical protein
MAPRSVEPCAPRISWTARKYSAVKLTCSTDDAMVKRGRPQSLQQISRSAIAGISEPPNTGRYVEMGSSPDALWGHLWLCSIAPSSLAKVIAGRCHLPGRSSALQSHRPHVSCLTLTANHVCSRVEPPRVKTPATLPITAVIRTDSITR